jgi:hypothetical protein
MSGRDSENVWESLRKCLGESQKMSGRVSENVWERLRKCLGETQKMSGRVLENVWESLRKCLGESQKMSGRDGMEKNFLPSSGIENFMGLSSRSLVNKPTELSR